MTGEIPAGWYPDPVDPNRIRYWDGTSWTDRTAPFAREPSSVEPATGKPERPGVEPRQPAWVTGSDRVDEARTTGAEASEEDLTELLGIPDSEPRRRARWLILVAAAIVLIVGGWYLFLRDGDDGGTAADDPPDVAETSTTSTTTTTTSSTTTTTTTTTVPLVEIVDVVGETADVAVATLEAAGLVVEVTEVEAVEVEPGTVTEVRPAAGTALAEGDTVEIDVAVALPVDCNDIEGQIQPTDFEDVLALGDPNAGLAVAWAQDKGITSGVSATAFGVDDVVSRGALVVLVHRYLCEPQPQSPASFDDVPADAFYAPAVAWATENDIVSGTDSSFDPEGPTTRAQWVTVLWRALGSPEADAVIPFTDVVESDFYMDALRWAVANNVAIGATATTFEPDAPLTRLDAVLLLYLLELTLDPAVV